MSLFFIIKKVGLRLEKIQRDLKRELLWRHVISQKHGFFSCWRGRRSGEGGRLEVLSSKRV